MRSLVAPPIPAKARAITQGLRDIVETHPRSLSQTPENISKRIYELGSRTEHLHSQDFPFSDVNASFREWNLGGSFFTPVWKREVGQRLKNQSFAAEEEICTEVHNALRYLTMLTMQILALKHYDEKQFLVAKNELILFGEKRMFPWSFWTAQHIERYLLLTSLEGGYGNVLVPAWTKQVPWAPPLAETTMSTCW